MCISVDLPEPDGPVMATNSSVLDAQRHVAQRGDLERAGRVDLADVEQLDDRGRSGRPRGSATSDGRSSVNRRTSRRPGTRPAGTRRRSRSVRNPPGETGRAG